MKPKIIFTIIAAMLSGTMALAEDYEKSMDSLGGNKELVRRAKAMDPNNKMQVVQNRTVNRNLRFEFGINYGFVAGGDPYLSSQTLGGTVDFHINPRWSVGARYSTSFNSLNSEGRRVLDDAQGKFAAQQVGAQTPQINYPLSTALGVINFYPFYGKLNLFDLGVAQFDFYLLAGGGQVQLSNGSSATYTGGGGVGIWITNHISSRLEVRYQNYHDQIWSGSRNIDAFVMTAGIGFLL